MHDEHDMKTIIESEEDSDQDLMDYIDSTNHATKAGLVTGDWVSLVLDCEGKKTKQSKTTVIKTMYYCGEITELKENDIYDSIGDH